MVERVNCPVCLTEGATVQPTTGDKKKVFCLRCGHFEHTRTISDDYLGKLKEEERAKISAWVYQQNSLGNRPTITTYDLEEIFKLQFPTFREKIEKFLKLAGKKVPMHRHRSQDWTSPDFISGTFSINQSEVEQIVNYLEEKGWIHKQMGQFSIKPEGYLEVDRLGNLISASTQGFVALWFDDEMQEAWERGFYPAIEEVGYKAFKVNMKQHNNKIDDEIIAEIRRSRFLVGDFTGHRGGVYFETGFAKGLGQEVFWTCKESDKKDLHFDIRQFNFILWKNPEDLKKQLGDRISAVLGDGPLKKI